MADLTRRQFLKSGLVLSAIGLLPGCYSSSKNKWLVSACTDQQGFHHVAAFDVNGYIVNQIALPARAHECLALPDKPGCALIVARRPGDYLLEVDFITGKVVNQTSSEQGFHFYGHGCLLPDGQHICTSENDYVKGEGRLVVRDRTTLKVVGKYESGGIGPHQIKVMPDNQTLVVANGGILTHPNQPRKKLNLDTMRPNLTYLELKSSKVLASFETENHQLSIRHLDVSSSGNVVVGMQYQGAKTDILPLLYSHRQQSQFEPFKASGTTWLSMKQYIASVCINPELNLVAASCPRANKITLWDLSSGEWLTEHKIKDGAGIEISDGGFWVSNGRGELLNATFSEKTEWFKQPSLKWDNHLTSIKAV